jgi:NhaP-type Na+/H+ or K+/H+ antiporter
MLLLAFAAVLLIGVLFSHLADRTILSTSALFLVAGLVLGAGGIGVIHLAPTDDLVYGLAELALFAVLYTDGMKLGWLDLRRAWRLPGRALLLGMPLTFGVTAVLAHFVVGLDWLPAMLIGAVLSPTDPVFAAALVGNKLVPPRLRHLLNVESGLNDGLALPFVIIFLGFATDPSESHLSDVALELLIGLVIGVVVPLIALKLEQTRFLAASHHYEPLTGVAIGLLVLSLCLITHGNLFIAAFAAGMTVATVGPRQRDTFNEFGELISELLKLAALLVFGALFSLAFVADLSWKGWAFAFLAIFVARPVALYASFVGSKLTWLEQAAAAWFGPKGFASVVYGLVILSSGIPDAERLFHLIAITVGLSILLHSSTDVVVARMFDDDSETPHWHRRQRDEGTSDAASRDDPEAAQDRAADDSGTADAR